MATQVSVTYTNFEERNAIWLVSSRLIQDPRYDPDTQSVRIAFDAATRNFIFICSNEEVLDSYRVELEALRTKWHGIIVE